MPSSCSWASRARRAAASAAPSAAPSAAAADPFFVAGVEAMRPVGTNSIGGGVREEVLPVEVDEEALVRTGSAGALEPKPAGSAGIKGHELRNSVM